MLGKVSLYYSLEDRITKLNAHGTITHGIYTSAQVQQVVTRQICNKQSRFQRFSASLDNMALPGEVMKVTLWHVGIISGRKLFTFAAQSLGIGLTLVTGEAQDPR